MNTKTTFDLTKIACVYGAPETDEERAVPVTSARVATQDALEAFLSGSCTSIVVQSGLEQLAWNYELQFQLPDIERAERYVEECWLEYLSEHPPVPPLPGSSEHAALGKVMSLAARSAESTSERPPESGNVHALAA